MRTLAAALPIVVAGNCQHSLANDGILEFFRDTDTVKLPASLSHLAGGGTIEVMVRFDSSDDPYPGGGIWSEQDGLGGEQKRLGINDQGTAFAGICCPGGQNLYGNIPIDTWTHLAMVVDTSRSEFRLYVAGELADIRDLAGIGDSPRGNSAIGAFQFFPDGSGDPLPSAHFGVDWVRASSTVRYTGESISVPAEETIEPDRFTDALYKFAEEPLGGTIIDEGPLGNHGLMGIGIPNATSPMWYSDARTPPCPGNLTRDDQVNAADLGILLAVWGDASQFPAADLNGDGSVDAADLGLMLGHWGPCPGG